MATFSKGPTLQLDEGEREELFLAIDDVLAWAEPPTGNIAEDAQVRDALASLERFQNALRLGMSFRDVESIRRDRSEYFRRKAESVGKRPEPVEWR